MSFPEIPLQHIRQDRESITRSSNEMDRSSLKPSHAPVSEDASDAVPLVNQRLESEHNKSLWHGLLVWWIPELLGSLLSLATFVSMVVVLKIFDNRTSANLHLPLQLTPNGLIAILATLNRAFLTTPVASAIMQDMWLYFATEGSKTVPRGRLKDMESWWNAAGGPLGSLMFFGRIRRYSVLTYLGCLVTVLALAYSTFTQQLLGHNLVQVDSNGTSLGNIPRTETWDTYIGAESQGIGLAPHSMLAAIYSAVFDADSQQLSIACPSGNCTWPLTPSLGACGECVPSTLTRKDCVDLPGTSSAPYCTYTFPTGAHVSTFDMENYTLGSSNGDAGAAGFFGIPTQEVKAGSHFASDPRAYFSTFYLFGVPYGSETSHVLSMTAAECALWMCVQVYNTSVNSTVQSDEIVATYTDYDEKEDGYTFLPLPPSVDRGVAARYTVSTKAFLALTYAMDEALNGTAYVAVDGMSASHAIIQGVWKGFDDPDTWISNMATSMSNVIRTNGTSRPQYDGAVYEIGIQIRWNWLILPAALVGASLLLLVAVMVRMAYSPVKSWKGSPLTLLLFKLEKDVWREAVSRLDEYGAVVKAVGNRKVGLGRDEKGAWKFKAA